jgi:preprotein translocase subunit SecF
MYGIFQRFRLSHQLWLLAVLLPLTAVLVLLVYVRTDYRWMMGLSVALLHVQVLWAAYGIRRFIFRIKQVRNALSKGRSGWAR